MVALRKWSGLYLAAASGYALAIIGSHHPLLVVQTREAVLGIETVAADAARTFEAHVIKPAQESVVNQAHAFLREWLPGRPSAQNRAAPEQIVDLTLAPVLRDASPRQALLSRPSRALGESHRSARGSIRTRQEQPGRALPPGPSEDDHSVRQAAMQAKHRLAINLTPELSANFELFLYVSKAESGPLAQHMYVFRKDSGGDLEMLHSWPVSTGRERVESNATGRVLPSFTPAGYYELDPDRFFVRYHSAQWDEPMPYAMFFNWIRAGNATGLAIHSAVGDDVAALGRRASAGCVRLSPEAAHQLFALIRTHYRGMAPRFPMDRSTDTMNNDGTLLRDATGKIERAEGYKVLVFIEDYGGRNSAATVF